MNIPEILRELATYEGATKLIIEFSGEGDSGGIDDIYTVHGPEEAYDERSLNGYRRDNGQTEHAHPFVHHYDDLDAYFCQEAVKRYDFYNNEGGQGKFTVDLLTGTVDLEVDIRYIRYESYEDTLAWNGEKYVKQEAND